MPIGYYKPGRNIVAGAQGVYSQYIRYQVSVPSIYRAVRTFTQVLTEYLLGTFSTKHQYQVSGQGIKYQYNLHRAVCIVTMFSTL